MYYEMIGFAAEPQGDGPCEVELPTVDLAQAAVFLDFDGTLVDLAPKPDGIAIPEDLANLLRTIDEKTGGRLVIVTGRSVEDLSAHLGGYDGAVIGAHGAQERFDGKLTQHPLAGSETVANLGKMVDGFAATHEGLVAETKPTGVVLHFRQVPDLEPHAYSFLHALEQSHEDFELHHSKMAYELRPKGISKDASIGRALEQPHFAGRRPIFFGDDVTDEPALGLINAYADGIAVKVGPGDSSAGFRVPDPDAARKVLRLWAGE